MKDLTIYEKLDVQEIDFSNLTFEEIKKGIKNVNIQATIITARALRHLKKSKLYKDQYKTFTQCVEKEFNMKKTQAYRLIFYAEVFDLFSQDKDIVYLPTHETQIRDLKKIKDDQVKKEIWKSAVNKNETPLGSDIKNLVKEYIEKQQKEGVIKKNKRNSISKTDLNKQILAKDEQIIELSQLIQQLKAENKKLEENQPVTKGLTEEQNDLLSANISLSKQVDLFERQINNIKEEIYEIKEKNDKLEKENNKLKEDLIVADKNYNVIVQLADQQYLESLKEIREAKEAVEHNKRVITLYGELCDKFLSTYSPEVRARLKKEMEDRFNALLNPAEVKS